MTACECGCGTEIGPDDRGRLRRYVHGHNHRGKSNTWSVKEVIRPRTSHIRAVKSKKDKTECEWLHIGDCMGDLQVAHVNGDEMDNDPSNLLLLCRSHHNLLDNGRIDPAAPVMPSFRVDSSGKRRYL